MPPPSQRMPALRWLAALLALAGCAAPTSSIRSGAAGGGTIVAMRPAPPASPARRSVLAALGVPPGAAPDGDVEFIIRADDGRPLSVVQNEAGDLHTGDRVALLRGLRTRIVPARLLRAGQ